MTCYDVRITDHALNDMAEIHEYICEKLFAPDAAMNQYNRIADAIEMLREFPERYRLLESEPERTQGIRILPVDNYAVLYTIRVSSVFVLRVLYGASNSVSRLRSDQ